MLKYLSAFRRFLVFHGVEPALAQKVAERILNKMNQGAELTGDEMRMGAFYIKLGDIKGDRQVGDPKSNRKIGDIKGEARIGDIKGEATRAAFLRDAIALGYTEVEWTYALSPDSSTSGTEQVNFGYSEIKPSYEKSAQDGGIGALRRRPAKITPPESGYTEVEWTYSAGGMKVPTPASIAKIASAIAA